MGRPVTLLDGVLSLSGVHAYVLIALVAAGEASALLGLFLPGETALLFGGVLASQGRVSLPVLLVVAVAAAMVGDTIGYEVGRYGGPALQRTRLGRVVGARRWAEGEAFLARRGGPAVFLGRWVGVLRALVPSLAGMGRMPYQRFLFWNALGGTVWATAVVLAGYEAGARYRVVVRALGQAGLVVAVAATAGLVVAVLLRRVRRRSVRLRATDGAPV